MSVEEPGGTHPLTAIADGLDAVKRQHAGWWTEGELGALDTVTYALRRLADQRDHHADEDGASTASRAARGPARRGGEPGDAVGRGI